MIAIQKIGKSFLGALNYNLKKLYHPDPKKRAELLDSNFASIDSKMIQRELTLVKSLRPNLNRYVYHTSLNFSKEDVLDNEKLLAIALDYLRESGYTNNQYLIFRHYDADHPHIHLLVNRITFDGGVVSDSNNYKKSEAVIRALEYRYNLIPVEQSSFVAVRQNNNISLEQRSHVNGKQGIHVTRQRANPVSRKYPTRDEVAMIHRTGKSSNKLLLQELIKHLIAGKPASILEFIRAGEKLGVYFLFNQASTGRVSGITYFFKDFKARGQALGEQFKWAEVIKKVNYDQLRDHNAISEANKRTKAIYGEFTQATPDPSKLIDRNNERTATPSTPEIVTDTNSISLNLAERSYTESRGDINIQISDDIDDEAIHGRNRQRKRQARINTR